MNQPAVMAPAIGGVATPVCRARVLTAWLPIDRLAQYLNNGQPTIDPRVQAQFDQYRAALAARGVVLCDTQVAEPRPEIAEHVGALGAVEAFQPYAAEGWTVKQVDLRAVVAAQPHVFSSAAGARFASGTTLDAQEIVRGALPLERQAQVGVMAMADPIGQLKSYKVMSDDVTLRADLGPDGMIRIAGQLSFMQVATFGERLVMRDGYHRAVELLARGITHVPVLHRAINNIDELFPPAQRPGLLPEPAWLGDTPPLLTDYLSPALAAVLDVPKPGKVLMIQITEVPWP